ncbi:LPP20 family lipoprotein [Pyxidicoccus sp. 3LG]
MRRSLWGLLLAVVPMTALGQGKEAKAPATEAARPAGASGAEGVRPMAPGVNWEGQVLRATGAGAPDLKAANPAQARLGAERAAKMDAFRNLLEQTKGIQLNAGRTVGDEMSRDEVRGRVEGAIRGYKVVAKRYFSDSGVEVDVEVPLAAITSSLVTPAPDSAIALNAEGAKKYTGLVVDARGLGVKPMLAPRLLDGTGKAVYGAAALSDESRATAGVAAWFDSLESAKKATLVGEKPLVVKATGLKGSDLVLASDDAKALTEVNTRFLAEGRVVIVTQ